MDVVLASGEQEQTVVRRFALGGDPVVGQRKEIVAVFPVQRDDLLRRFLSVGYCCVGVKIAFVPGFAVFVCEHSMPFFVWKLSDFRQNHGHHIFDRMTVTLPPVPRTEYSPMPAGRK